MTVSSLSMLPNDVLFARLLSIATKKDDKVIVDDHSTGTKFGYTQILHGIVRLRQKLKDVLWEEISQDSGQFYVALLAPNGYEFIIGVLAVLACGGVVVPMPTGALPTEAAYILRQCDARCVIVSHELSDLASEIQKEVDILSVIIDNSDCDGFNVPSATAYSLDSSVPTAEETPSVLFFTSGTTGPPKGVLHARRTINKYARMQEEPESNDEICIIPRGAFWSIYFTKLFQMLLTGVRVEIQNFGRNYNLIWEKFREKTGTKIVLSPTFWYGMMRHYEAHIANLPHEEIQEYVEGVRYIRDATATGAMPSSRVKEFWQDMRGGRPLKVLYGSTETQEIAVWNGDSTSDESDLGTPLPSVSLKLSNGDEGEILVKAPSQFLRYLNAPDATAKRFDSEGFFKTGDMAILQNGRFIFKGRENMDRQSSSLLTVYPSCNLTAFLTLVFKFYTYKVPRTQVEASLTALPYVSEGYVLPVEDPQCDTRTAALVRFHDSARGVDLQALRDDLSKSMPAYQLPTVLRVLKEHETVPRTWSDKTAMMKAVHMFFPQDSQDRICGESTEVMDIGDFMKMKTTKPWELSGMR
ncbi:unnamed protein product [Penicillium salamii]|uniref:AMP-dependent synthetase/ligase domain-containing protein n=1 Tax=Penicillium salamii TaxID=1612424 RepID=A0A9W4NUA5_9EURO|nr:unnamed protein product [Penicillium salamii]